MITEWLENPEAFCGALIDLRLIPEQRRDVALQYLHNPHKEFAWHNITQMVYYFTRVSLDDMWRHKGLAPLIEARLAAARARGATHE